MGTYKEAGVDVNLGDECSRLAYKAAKKTFSGRRGLIGEPIFLEGGFTGMLDFGDFYLVQNDDGIGTKVMIAEAIGKYDTLGYDLLAMVADDAVCVGAEVISVSNVIDNMKLDANRTEILMEGLAKACLEQKIVIPGGEIGELSDLINGFVWNATAVGIVEKNKFIDTAKVQPGDKLIGLQCRGFRSNGFSLVRHVLRNAYGDNWHEQSYAEGVSWGELTLSPAIIFHNAILELHGRYKQPSLVEIKGLAHITGGGIPGNLARVLERNKVGAYLHSLPKPPEPMLRLQDMDTVRDDEAYETWNMGVGMIMVCNEVDTVISHLANHNIKAQVIGEITKEPGIRLVSQGFFEAGKELKF